MSAPINGSVFGPDIPIWKADQTREEYHQEVEDAKALRVLRGKENARRALDAERAADAAGSTRGWKAVDLGPVLSGERRRVLPTLGRRSDGAALLYPGKEHMIASEPECGKTWWCALIVMEVLKAGGRVAYIDFEDDEDTIVGERLIPLGVPVDLLRNDAGRFRYYSPDRQSTALELERDVMLSFSAGGPEAPIGPDLVVLDGMTEGMGLFGWKITENDDITAWRRTLVKPFMAYGAATLTSDHVVKDRDSRGRYSIGGQHKLAGLTGAMFTMEQGDPFGEGLKGRSRLYVTKDRNGKLRKHGRPDSRPGFTYFGDLVGDGTGDTPSFAFYPPTSEEEMESSKTRQAVGHAGALLAIIRRIEGVTGGSPGIARLYDEMKGKGARKGLGKNAVDNAVEYLIEQGCIEIVDGPRNKKEHRYIKDLTPQPMSDLAIPDISALLDS